MPERVVVLGFDLYYCLPDEEKEQIKWVEN